MSTPARPLVRLAAVVLALGLLAGCSGAGDSSHESAADGGDSSAQEHAGPAANGGIAASDVAATDMDVDREIVTTGSATLVTTDVHAAAKDLADLTEAAGGRVEQRRESGGDGEALASADLTLRIPADRTTAAIEALGEIGEVHDLDIQAADVTGAARDLDARIEALQTSVDRLRALMESAGTTTDLLAAEQELTTRQADLESMRSQRALLSDQVAMSTLTVWIVEETPEAELAPGASSAGSRTAGRRSCPRSTVPW